MTSRKPRQADTVTADLAGQDGGVLAPATMPSCCCFMPKDPPHGEPQWQGIS